MFHPCSSVANVLFVFGWTCEHFSPLLVEREEKCTGSTPSAVDTRPAASPPRSREPLTLRSSSCRTGMRGSGRHRDRPVDAVVGHEHAVLLQPLQDRLHLRREAARCRSPCRSRRRSPMRGRFSSVMLAGEVRRRVDVGPRASSPPSRAWRARPCRASARRSAPRPGRSAGPAASDEVQPSGRSLFDFRSKIDACRPPASRRRSSSAGRTRTACGWSDRRRWRAGRRPP